MGRRSHEEVLDLENKAKVLVNLRNPNDALTKYSFPSKLMEYLNSGALVVSTRLSGIPSEYFDYLTSLETLSAESLSALLTQLMMLSDDAVLSRGQKSKEFLSKNKSYISQSEKIINFIANN